MAGGVRGFALTKWYLDVASSDGEAAIAYVAHLSWGALSLGYASVLAPGGVRASVRGAAAPDIVGATARWSCTRLGARGEWEGLEVPVVREIYPGVVWHLLGSRCRARLAGIEGLGYVERLELTISPWSMPIDELRWGRFISDDGARSRVWIDWRGAHRARLCVDDGAGVSDAEHGIAFERERLLRQGAIGKTALAVLPRRVRGALPGRILMVDERKWVARARLGDVGGWAIHEIVRWPS